MFKLTDLFSGFLFHTFDEAMQFFDCMLMPELIMFVFCINVLFSIIRDISRMSRG